MASPQPDKFTRISNEIVEHLAYYRLSGEEYQILWVIWRKTYGWKKKSDCIALQQFQKFTKMKKSNICRALKKLEDKNIIIKKDNSVANEYRFNKDFDSWKPLSKKITLSKKIIPVIKKDNKSLSKKIHTKDNYTKETITKENYKGRILNILMKENKKYGLIKTSSKKKWNKIYELCLIRFEDDYSLLNICHAQRGMWKVYNSDKTWWNRKKDLIELLTRGQSKTSNSWIWLDEFKNVYFAGIKGSRFELKRKPKESRWF